ncbi:MAG: Clp protease ClpP [Reinekea sp.]
MAKIISISGEIGWDVYPNDIRNQIKEAKGEDIVFEISSPGGYVYDGLEIFNMIKNYEGNTTAKIVGMAASMASYIPLAADRVIAESNAIYMIHNARAYAYGDQNALTKTANILTGLSNLLASRYIAKTGKNKKEIKSLMDAETYFFGNEILEAGFVDEMINVDDDATAKDDKILDAMLKVEAVIEKIKQNPEKEQNIDKIAAYLKPNKPEPPVNPTQTEQNPMNEEQFLAFLEKTPEAKAYFETFKAEKSGPNLEAMALADVLKLAPQAKSEYETAISDAKTAISDAKTAVEADKLSKADAKFIGKILACEEYDQATKDIGIEAFAGEVDLKTFKLFVAQADSLNEKFKQLKIKGDQPGATPGEDHTKEAMAAAKAKASANALGQKLGTAKPEAK